MSLTFTIVSKGASLLEVDGDGPTTDRPDGLAVPDGVPTIAPVSLLSGFIRRFRVDAPPTAKATITVTDSPFGVFVGVRRCTATPATGMNRIVVANGKQRATWLWRVLKRRVPSLVALWNLFVDEPACAWGDVGDNNSNYVTANGGDLVVLTFVSP